MGATSVIPQRSAPSLRAWRSSAYRKTGCAVAVYCFWGTLTQVLALRDERSQSKAYTVVLSDNSLQNLFFGEALLRGAAMGAFSAKPLFAEPMFVRPSSNFLFLQNRFLQAVFGRVVFLSACV